MRKIKIPDYIKEWFQDQGIDKLPDFLQPNFVINLSQSEKLAPYKLPEWAKGEQLSESVSIAGNATKSLTAPSGYVYLVLSGRFRLVCDATVANRGLYFVVQDSDGNDVDWIGQSATLITASQTKDVAFGQTRTPDQTWNYLKDGYSLAYTGISPIRLDAGWTLLITVNQGQLGDALTGNINYVRIEV